jgi:Putative zinc-finger
MGCRKIEKWISDGIDERLSPEKQAILKTHLSECASCRAYRERLATIQKESQRLFSPQIAPQHWKESFSRLKTGLEPEEKTGRKRRERWMPANFPKRGWAWAGAALFLAAASGLYFILSGPNARQEIMAFSFEDAVNGIDQEIKNNPELEKYFNAFIQDSIHEHVGEISELANPFHYENPLFLESLNEEELQLLESALKKELKL